MSKVIMIKDAQGAPDHLKVIAYKEGQTYDIPDFLSKVFVEDMKVAEYPGRRSEAPAEAKMQTGAPENKSDAPAVETKKDEPVKEKAARRQ